MIFKRTIAITALLSILATVFGQVRFKDLAQMQGIESQQVIGYGLIIGLNGTGDSKRSEFTTQSVVNMLQRFGVTVPVQRVKPKNVAAVMVTTEIPVFARKGDKLDVTVSSLGDAKSLEGGVLLMTPLAIGQGDVVAMAQGAVSVGGFNVETSGGGGVRQNHPLVGRIPGGAQVQRSMGGNYSMSDVLVYSLAQKDITTAQRAVVAINNAFGAGTANQVDPYTIQILIPDTYKMQNQHFAFVALVEQLTVNPDVAARVVINERTGTVIVGGNVTLLPAAIAHGNLSVEIASSPIVSQPAPFSQGQTTVVPNTSASVYQDERPVVTVGGATTVQEVTEALNAVGLMPRDIIGVIQALKTAGSLHAELIIM